MSILIKGMKMPKSCGYCPLRYEARDGDECYLGASLTEYQKRPDDCPLVSVPPHGDLIDRDPFIEFIKTHWDGYDQWFVGQLEARPTIIPAEEGET